MISQDSNVVLKVDNLSKKFCRNLKYSLIHGLSDIVRSIFRFKIRSGKLRKHEFWALKNIKFELKRGEVIGVVGTNGCGKTTLLRLISGIYPPDVGEIQIQGRIGALIAVGAGFHPNMTGRENIFLNGSILGMSKEEISAKYSQIVDFADIGDFLEAPVSTYSSGMRIRLGFSIAIYCEPDILLIDEILSVGDIQFQNKSYRKILELKQKSSIIFVSHNMRSVSVLCDKVIWMEKGVIKKIGQASEILEEYINQANTEMLEKENFSDANFTYSGDIYVEKVNLKNNLNQKTSKFFNGDTIIVEIVYNANKYIEKPFFELGIRSPKYGIVLTATMFSDLFEREDIEKKEGVLICKFKSIPLSPGQYIIDLNIQPSTKMGKLFRHEMLQTFEVLSKKTDSAISTYFDYYAGPVEIPYEWVYEK